MYTNANLKISLYVRVHTFSLIGIHSMQGWTGKEKEKETQKD